MSRRYDIITPINYIDRRTGKEATQWQHVGVGYANEDGSFAIELKAIPLPVTDQQGFPKIKLRMSLPRERDDRPQQRQQPQREPGDDGDDLNF